MAMLTSGLVFIHVAYAVGTLLVLILVDRALYRVRAERYVFLNPSSRPPPRMSGFIGRMAPWSRPDPPAYDRVARVRGTGDVEDQIIAAAPPPPAYGNTRDSTLLLANFTRRASQRSQRSQREVSDRRLADEELGLSVETPSPAERDAEEVDLGEVAATARRLENALAGPEARAPSA